MSETSETKSIWFRTPTVEAMNEWARGSMLEHLGITITAVGPDYLEGSMPVDHRTRQPFGVLHGGASVVLAETLGSMAGAWCLDLDRQYCVGIEVNANHLRSVREGVVYGTARPLHLGRRTQVWEIDLRDAEAERVCISRLTLAVIER